MKRKYGQGEDNIFAAPPIAPTADSSFSCVLISFKKEMLYPDLSWFVNLFCTFLWYRFEIFLSS